jgi:hypothetical protein
MPAQRTCDNVCRLPVTNMTGLLNLMLYVLEVQDSTDEHSAPNRRLPFMQALSSVGRDDQKLKEHVLNPTGAT